MKEAPAYKNYELIPINDKTNVRFFTSIDSGSYVTPHWHDALEIIYLLEGTLQIIVGNNAKHLEAGQCAMITPNQIHSTLCTRPNRAIVFQIPKAFMEKFIPRAENLYFSLQDPADTPILQGKVELFKETLVKMQLLTDLQPDGAVLRFNSLLFEVLFQLYHNFSTEIPRKTTTRHSRNLERLEPVLQYISSNYNRPISLEEISRIAILQPKYFCRFFKKCMGVTFLEYQNEIRLSKIYKDVTSTSDRISEILERHGFTNYKLFRKMFSQRFHATPTSLRKHPL